MMTPLLREPLLHFFLLAAAIFALFALLDDTPPPRAETVIALSIEDGARLAAGFEATWKRPPNPAELDRLIDAAIREEIYVREAIALGLDRDDAIIRRRLQAKMEFLIDSGGASALPDEATLEAHLAQAPDRFAQPAQIAFDQILLPEGIAPSALEQIRAGLNDGLDPAPPSQPSLLPDHLPLSSPQAVDRHFGSGFFDRIADQPMGLWAGPVPSPYGRHLIRVRQHQPRRLPPLDEIRAEVERDWRFTMTEALREDLFQSLRTRYRIERPDPAEILTQ